jgi:hypothetical protein
VAVLSNEALRAVTRALACQGRALGAAAVQITPSFALRPEFPACTIGRREM